MNERITVRRSANSTPHHQFDFDAWYGDLDLGVTVGHGATPNEAIADLEEKREAQRVF